VILLIRNVHTEIRLQTDRLNLIKRVTNGSAVFDRYEYSRRNSGEAGFQVDIGCLVVWMELGQGAGSRQDMMRAKTMELMAKIPHKISAYYRAPGGGPP
jgi:hypothetical protein